MDLLSQRIHRLTHRRLIGMARILVAMENIAPQQTRLTRADGSPVRAVVVDDEDSLTDLLSMALRYEGWDVRTAADGQRALAVIREFQPDVVILDVMLPDIDGLTVLSRLRSDGDQVPVLFLTAKDAGQVAVALMVDRR